MARRKARHFPLKEPGQGWSVGVASCRRRIVLDEAVAILAMPSEPFMDHESTVSTPLEVSAATVDVPIASAHCPACGGSETARIPRRRLFIFFALGFLGVGLAVRQVQMALAGVAAMAILFAVMPGRRCLACGHRWSAAGARTEIDDAPLPDPADMVGRVCPRCGSEEFYPIRYRRLQAFSLLLDVAVLPVVAIWVFLPKLQCDHCDLKLRANRRSKAAR
jgi:hypothetical protein